MTAATATIVIEGNRAAGDALVLTAPISFWGGVDPRSGTIIDVRHPQCGEKIAGKILFIPATVGSSTASTILLELVHAGVAPAAIVLHEPDAILLLGLIAAREIGLAVPAALTLDRANYAEFAGKHITIGSDGLLSVAADRSSSQ